MAAGKSATSSSTARASSARAPSHLRAYTRKNGDSAVARDPPPIATIVACIGLAFFFGLAVQKLRLPPIAGYLLAGVMLGPFTPGFVADQKLSTELAELGVILLIFGVGLHFSLNDLLSVRTIAVPGAVGQIVIATLLGLGLSTLMLGWSLTRSVRDSAVMLDVAAGPDIGDPYYAPPQPGRYLDAIAVPPPRLRIAFSVLDPFAKEIDPECRAAVATAANLCANLGHDVEEGHPPIEVGQLASDFMSIWASGLASLIEGIARLTGKRPAADCFQGLTWSLYQYGRTVSAAQYLMGWAALQGAARRIALWHQQYDVWLTTVLSRPPARIGEFDVGVQDWAKGYEPFVGYAPFTALQNATGQPAISVPLHWTFDNLPIGIQFVGRFGDEQLLLQLAAQLEQARPWSKHIADPLTAPA